MRAVSVAPDGQRPGWDFAGIVASDSTNSYAPGTRVVGLHPKGTWAERVAVPARSLARLPDDVTFAQAAALATVSTSAMRMLRMAGSILGQRVLVSAATGGVGRFALQLAHLGGAHVTALIGSSSARSQGLADLGANEIVNDVDRLDGSFDLILDSVGGETLGKLMTRLDQRGTLVIFGNSSERATTFNVRDIYLDGARTYRTFELFFGDEPFGRDLGYLVGLVAH